MMLGLPVITTVPRKGVASADDRTQCFKSAMRLRIAFDRKYGAR